MLLATLPRVREACGKDRWAYVLCAIGLFELCGKVYDAAAGVNELPLLPRTN